MRFLALLFVVAAPIFAQQCTSYSLSANTFVAGAGASSSNPSPSFKVSTSPGTANCPFTASTNASWIHILNGPTYPNQDTVCTTTPNTCVTAVQFALDSNQASTTLRKDVITLTSPVGSTTATVTITQVAGICQYSLSGTSDHQSVAGGTGNFTITSGCAYTVASSQGWVNLGSLSNFLGNGSVNYTVAPNACVAARTATLTVETGQYNAPTYQITEDGSPNNLTVAPTGTTVGSGTGVGRFSVATGATCNWNAYSDASWLHITGASSGGGNGGISYTIDANTGPQRAGSIHVGPALFTVTQFGVAAPVPTLTAVVNGASYNNNATPPYSTGPVSPGEIVALFGQNLGPAAGAPYLLSTDGQSISNVLAGVQVLFNSIAAPLLYVSATQINAIVPMALAGSSNVSIQVIYLGTAGNTLTEPVQTANPGVFSYDHTGAGPGAILNQDYSLNTGNNPAVRGSSAILIYCTGTGLTNPPGSDGVLTGLTQPFPTVVAPVSVTIGGVAAQVVYDGAAPGSIAGLTQINAMVPANVPAGVLPVVVTVGGVSSQGGITVAVQ